MAGQRPISEAPEQSLYGQPQVSFRPNDFNSVIWAHGYDIICERRYAVRVRELGQSVT